MKLIIGVVFSLMVLGAETKQKKKKKCSPPCDPGWTQWKDSCYRFYNEPKKFNDAEEYCNQFENHGSECRRGHLVAIDSSDENEFILNWWKTLRAADVSAVHIGFTDAFSEGSWNWSNGMSPTFTNWDVSQPDNAGAGQNCAMIWKRSGDKGFWDDGNCSARRPFICEIKTN